MSATRAQRHSLAFMDKFVGSCEAELFKYHQITTSRGAQGHGQVHSASSSSLYSQPIRPSALESSSRSQVHSARLVFLEEISAYLPESVTAPEFIRFCISRRSSTHDIALRPSPSPTTYPLISGRAGDSVSCGVNGAQLTSF